MVLQKLVIICANVLISLYYWDGIFYIKIELCMLHEIYYSMLLQDS
jgi:hypothetical protein